MAILNRTIKEIISIILTIGLAFVLVVCFKIFYQNEQITIAKGFSENPENPKIAMELNENGDVFVYIDSVSKRKIDYFFRPCWCFSFVPPLLCVFHQQSCDSQRKNR
jgi:hypothetical protein